MLATFAIIAGYTEYTVWRGCCKANVMYIAVSQFGGWILWRLQPMRPPLLSIGNGHGPAFAAALQLF